MKWHYTIRYDIMQLSIKDRNKDSLAVKPNHGYSVVD